MFLSLFYIIIFFLIKKELQNSSLYEKRYFTICVFACVILAIMYRIVLIDQGIEYGLANLDMKLYMDLAQKVSRCSLNEGFKAISNHWNFQDTNFIQIWGYRFYIYWLAILIFKFNFMNVETSVYLVSILQVIIANYSVLIIYNTLKERNLKYKKTSFFLMLTAPSIWFGSVRLLRESIMLFCIAVIIRLYYQKQGNWIFKIILPMLLLTVNRPYYTLFLALLCIILEEKIVIGNFVCGAVFFGLFFLCIYLQVPLSNIIKVVLSPNFFNQVHELNQNSIIAGRIPIINYIGSIWNLFMLFFLIFSLLNKGKRYESLLCISLIIGICMIYAIVYDGNTELRHKMFFVIPYILLLNNGLDKLKNNKSMVLILFTLIMFIVFYSLVVLLIGR